MPYIYIYKIEVKHINSELKNELIKINLQKRTYKNIADPIGELVIHRA